MKKIILLTLLLIIMAFGGLFAYVSQMDWNTQKEKLSAQLTEITGKKIQFSGDLHVKLLPHPQLSAADVNILNSQTGDKLATIKNLETEITLSSLLHRKTDIQSLSLEGVEAWFNFDKDGNSNWKQSSQQDSLSNENSLNLHNFNIKKSTIHFDHKKYDVAFDLTAFNADVQVGGPNGPYRLDGSFLKNDDRYGIALNVDSLSQLEGVGMSLVVTHPATESNLRYDGSYNAVDDGISGDFSGQSQKTADFVNSLINKKLIRDEFNVPLMFSTTLQFDTNENKFSNLVVKFDKILEGAGNISIPAAQKDKNREVNVKYQLVKLNLLPFIDLLKEYFKEYQGEKRYEPDFDFDVNYDITAERLIVSKETSGVFESVSAKGAWKDNIFSIDDFYAGCPGNITLGIKASLAEKESAPQYYSEIKINGQNALSFINALGVKVKSPRQSSYRDIDLSFDMYGTPQILRVENINLKMDKAEVQGNITADLLQNEYLISAQADILNLDNYILLENTEQKTSVEENAVALTKGFSWLADNKAEINIMAGSATLDGVSARDVKLDFATDGKGTVAVESASLNNILGADIQISGLIKNWGRNDLLFDEMVFDIKSSNLKMLTDKWQIEMPKWPLFERGKIEESGVLVGNFKKMYINSLTQAGEHSFRYDGTLDRDKENTEFSGNILIKTNHMENLFKILDDSIGGKTYRGPLSAKAKISGNTAEWELKKAEIQMGMDKYTTNLYITKDKKGHKISGSVYTTYLNLLNWINIQKTKSIPKFVSNGDDTFITKPNFNSDVINYNGYRAWALDIDLKADKSSYGEYSMNNLQAHIFNGQSLLRFQNLHFENKKHKVSGNLQINYAQTPQLSGNLTIIYPKIKNLGGNLYSLSAENVTINSEFETSAVTVNDMIDGLKGKISVSGKNLDLKGINLAGIRDDLKDREYSKGLYKVVKDNTQSGETSFNEFKIETLISNALLTISPTVLKNEYSKVNLVGTLNLKEWKINNTLTVTYPELKNIPSYSIAVSGMLNKPTVDINISEIVNKYDKHWKEIEQEHLKQQELLKQQQAKKIGEVMDYIDETNNNATAVLHDLEESMSKHLTEGIVSKYKEKISQINQISSMLDKTKTTLTPELSDEEIAKHKNSISEYQQKIDSIKSSIQNMYTEDIEGKKKELTARESNVYSKISEIHQDFFNMWQKDRDQLGLYNSLSYIDNNEELNTNYFKIQESKSSADSIHADIESRYAQFDVPDNWDEKHILAERIEELTEQEENLYSQMQSAQQESADMLVKIIEERRVAFDEEQRKAEKERRIQAEQDAQNLLISNNPNPVIENPDTPPEPENVDTSAGNISFEENNQTTENAPSENVIKTSSGVSGKIITNYDKNETTNDSPQNYSSGLLSPMTGKSSGVSGSLKVK